MSTNHRSPLSENQILAALPSKDYERLAPHLERYTMTHGDMLYRVSQPIKHVYFPLRAMISMVAVTADGGAVEVGVIGREGMTGLSVVLGVDRSSADVMVQLPDDSLRLCVEVLMEEFQRAGALQKVLLRYAHALMILLGQSAACTRLHHVSERLARWLLMCQDRVLSNEIPLTHEFLSMMLGIRRSGVTETALTLQAEGLIRYSRGLIAITDRKGMEGFACECYRVVKAEFDRLAQEPRRPFKELTSSDRGRPIPNKAKPQLRPTVLRRDANKKRCGFTSPCSDRASHARLNRPSVRKGTLRDWRIGSSSVIVWTLITPLFPPVGVASAVGFGNTFPPRLFVLAANNAAEIANKSGGGISNIYQPDRHTIHTNER